MNCLMWIIVEIYNDTFLGKVLPTEVQSQLYYGSSFVPEERLWQTPHRLLLPPKSGREPTG